MAEFADVGPAAAAVAPRPEENIQMQASGTLPTDHDILAKYEQERLKRLREDGNAQYIDPSLHPKLKSFQQDIWAQDLPNPGLDRARTGDKHKVVLLGAGFGGLSTAARLKRAGIDDVAILDIAGGFGGTWYWNRYPGLMCDVESYIYMPLLEETGYIPKHKYSSGHELRQYAELLADTFQLRHKAIFRVKVETIKWDDEKSHYVIDLTRLDGQGSLQILADVIVSNCGAINLPKMPDLPGMLDFAGYSFHTSRWDYSYTGGTPENPDLTNLGNKRVGIIGTGATAIQAVPHLGKWAKELYVFQRTPSAVDVRNNRETDPEWFKKEVAGSGPGWQLRRQENFNLHVADVDLDVDLVADAWTSMRTFSYVVGTPKINRMKDIPSFLAEAQAQDLPRQKRIRKRVEDTVEDKATAEKLKPWYSGWCKRPCFHDEYLPTFNRPNVHLVDTDGKGVDKVTANGVVVAGKEYPLDVLIFGTGYWIKGGESPCGKANFKAYGKGGISMDDKWTEKITTLHGLITEAFPNYFFPGPNQSGAAANMVYGMSTFANHLAYILTEAYKKSSGRRVLIEGEPAAMEDWSQQIVSKAVAFAALGGCTPSYLNGEGAVGKPMPPEVLAKAARAALWGEGVQSYIDILTKWRADGDLKGLKITPLAT